MSTISELERTCFYISIRLISKSFFALFGHNICIDDFGVHLIGLVDRSGFISITAVSFYALFLPFEVELFKAEIGEPKLIFVFGLKVKAIASPSYRKPWKK